ncbi:MAG: circadian clock protein KaiC, partial [Ferruginibacter sp.]|nr:circadian clock protein KaiC [Ferruginibacter sp.]
GIGCGKTFMAMEYIVNGVKLYNEPGVFMTFEEKTDELMTNVANLGYDLKKRIAEKKIYLEHLEISHSIINEAGSYKIDGLFVRLNEAIQKINAKRVVLDSLDTLFASVDKRTLRTEFKRLFSWLKEKKVTAIITAELGDIFVTRLGLEELVADCVIELNNRVVDQIAIRRLRILKYRGSFFASNEYPFIIDEKGMTVYPIVTRGIDPVSSEERISSGNEQIDKMLENKGFFLGSSILVSGTAGTGKTSITSTFANSVCLQNKCCLYCGFEESPSQILRNMKSIGIDLNQHYRSGLLHFYFARPTIQNLELHFMAIKDMIEKIQPYAIILDPVTNLMTEGPNSDVRSMLTRFIDYLKTKQLTVMFSAAITIGTIQRNPSDEGISSMVDTWIMLDDIEWEGKRHIALYIIKSRGMRHDRAIKELVFTNKGIELMLLKTIQKESNTIAKSYASDKKY